MWRCHPDDRIGVNGVEIEDGSDSEAEAAEAEAAAEAALLPSVEEAASEGPTRRSKRGKSS